MRPADRVPAAPLMTTSLRERIALHTWTLDKTPLPEVLDIARAILAMADHPNCGLLLDAYHLHCSGSVGRAFETLPDEHIFTFQYSDAPANPVQVRTATDRLPPGKGVIPWGDVFQLLMEKNYRGYVAYEAPNPAQWSRPPAEVAREAVMATRAFIAQTEARMGGA